jgi:hypothetical protein
VKRLRTLSLLSWTAQRTGMSPLGRCRHLRNKISWCALNKPSITSPSRETSGGAGANTTPTGNHAKSLLHGCSQRNASQNYQQPQRSTSAMLAVGSQKMRVLKMRDGSDVANDDTSSLKEEVSNLHIPLTIRSSSTKAALPVTIVWQMACRWLLSTGPVPAHGQRPHASHRPVLKFRLRCFDGAMVLNARCGVS